MPMGIAQVPRKALVRKLMGVPRKCVSVVIDAICFTFLIIPHSVETVQETGRWLSILTEYVCVCVLVCLFSAGSSDNSSRLCSVTHTDNLTVSVQIVVVMGRRHRSWAVRSHAECWRCLLIYWWSLAYDDIFWSQNWSLFTQHTTWLQWNVFCMTAFINENVFIFICIYWFPSDHKKFKNEHLIWNDYSFARQPKNMLNTYKYI